MTLESQIMAMQARLREQRQWAALDVSKLVQQVFGTPDGETLLAVLCSVENPLDQTFCADARQSAQLAGRREVIGFLWRHAKVTEQPPELPIENNGQTKETSA